MPRLGASRGIDASSPIRGCPSVSVRSPAGGGGAVGGAVAVGGLAVGRSAVAVPPWVKENPLPALYPPERSSIEPVGFSGGASEIRRRRYSVEPGHERDQNQDCDDGDQNPGFGSHAGHTLTTLVRVASAACRSATYSVGRSRSAAPTRSPVSTATAAAPAAPRTLGSHTICTVVTTEFLAFQASVGNDLGTPRPEYGFPGLTPGDRWCVVAARWQQACDAGVAAPVVLAATHERALEVVSLEDLHRNAVDVPDDIGGLL